MISVASSLAFASLLAPGASAHRTSIIRELRGASGARSLNADFVCDAPWGDLSGWEEVMSVSKLQAPNSDTEVHDLEGVCNQYFFAEGDYCRFITDDQRSELRIPQATDDTDGFVAEDAVSKLSCTLRLPTKDIGDSEHYTWMQVHGDDTSYIRFAHYGKKEGLEDWLWVYVKTGSSSSYSFESHPIMEMPSGDFDASIEFDGGSFTLKVDDWSLSEDVDWSDDKNYYKIGAYIQIGDPEDFPVDYKSCSYSLSSGVNDA